MSEQPVPDSEEDDSDYVQGACSAVLRGRFTAWLVHRIKHMPTGQSPRYAGDLGVVSRKMLQTTLRIRVSGKPKSSFSVQT